MARKNSPEPRATGLEPGVAQPQRRRRDGVPHRPGIRPSPAANFGLEPGSAPGGRWGGRAARGEVRTAVLALLAERQRHGYEIIQQIIARSAGRWRPSPGSVYPTIAQLEGEGLVRIEQAPGRRVVHLTEQGQRHADEHAAALAAVFGTAVSGTADAMDDPVSGLHQAASQVSTAAAVMAQAGSDRQIAQAREVLAETRRRIYRILADDQDPAPS
jgi:DNA-binding PadR family transcriptional regulator